MSKNNVITCVRYVWKVKDGKKDNLCIKYLCGLQEEHKKFTEALVKSAEVVSAVAEYQYTIEPERVAKVEQIKSEVVNQ